MQNVCYKYVVLVSGGGNGACRLKGGNGRVVLCVTAGSLGDRSLDELTSSFLIIIEKFL